MIMMRSNPTSNKLGGKPPPPVPPRPSKTLVQEALAKTRKVMRAAPPPPNQGGLEKSKSSVNIILKKSPNFERSISEEIKSSNNRPIVYMSANVKTVEQQLNNNKVSKVPDCDEVNSIEKCDIKDDGTLSSSTNSSTTNSLDKKWDKILNDRNHVNTLIDEMFASVLEVSGLEDSDSSQETPKTPATEEVTVTKEATQIKIHNPDVESKPKTVIVINNENTANSEKNDKLNHEFLINELQTMKQDQERILRRQRKPSMNIYDRENPSEVSKIQCSDWVELGDGGKEVHLSSCQITIEDFQKSKDNAMTLDCERINKMSSLHGLPPLPKSLSGFNFLENQSNQNQKPPTPVRTSSIRSGQSGQHSHLKHPVQQNKLNGQPEQMARKQTHLDSQLAILRREMVSLRQLDLSLLSQLWSLNESIQDFRQMLQDQDDRLMPPSPSPTNSSGDEGEEEEEDDDFYTPPTATTTISSTRSLRPAPPPPPIRRPSSSSNASSLG